MWVSKSEGPNIDPRYYISLILQGHREKDLSKQPHGMLPRPDQLKQKLNSSIGPWASKHENNCGV